MKNKINLDQLEKIIFSINKKKITLNEENSFEELGLDSLDIYTLFVEIQDLTKIEVSDDQFDKIKKIKDLINFFNDQKK